MLAILTKIVTHPIVAGLLIPSLSDALAKFFERQADRAEHHAAAIQARAAGKIDDQVKRAEALREASKKLSDCTMHR